MLHKKHIKVKILIIKINNYQYNILNFTYNFISFNEGGVVFALNTNNL